MNAVTLPTRAHRPWRDAVSFAWRAWREMTLRQWAAALVIGLVITLVALPSRFEMIQKVGWHPLPALTEIALPLVTSIIMFLGWTLADAGDDRWRDRRSRVVIALLGASAAATVLCGGLWYGAGAAELVARVVAEKGKDPPSAWLMLIAQYVNVLVIGAVIYAVIEVWQQRCRTQLEFEAVQRRRGALEHEVLESRLSAMQAQVEPRFLFDTLVDIARCPSTSARHRLHDRGGAGPGEGLPRGRDLAARRPACTHDRAGRRMQAEPLLSNAAAAADPARGAPSFRRAAGANRHRRAQRRTGNGGGVARRHGGRLCGRSGAGAGTRAAGGPVRGIGHAGLCRGGRRRHRADPAHSGKRRGSGPMNATAIVAEDEATLRQQLVEQLGQLWPELTIVAEASDGVAALRLLAEHRPDIVFLDIQMPGATGLEVARQVNGRTRVVFVTAYDEHAVAAFEQGAVDYVLKPISAARLFTTVTRLKERLASPPPRLDAVLPAIAPTAAKSYLRWINASVGQSLRLITVDEIVYFQADNKYTRVVTADGEALIRKPLKELAEELDPNQFWQIHRSTMVNVASVAGVTRDFRGRMLVKLKGRSETLQVSDSYTHLFRQM